MLYILWIKFILVAGVLIFCGYKVSKIALFITKKNVFSESFMGLIFLAFVTSFPEVFTSLFSVTSARSPDLACGDVIGSIIINLMIIAILDFQQGKGSILYQVRIGNILTIGLVIILLSIVNLSIILSSNFGISGTLKNLGIDSIIILIIILLGYRLIYIYDKKVNIKPSLNDQISLKVDTSIIKLWAQFLLFSFFVIFSGFWLANLGDRIVKLTMLNHSYFGTIFLGITTSLPELIVAISALKIGSIEMAIGDILGSNFFDISILPICDFFFREKAFLSSVSSFHIFTSSMAIILSGILIVGIIFRTKKSVAKLGLDIIFMVIFFIIANFFLFMIGK